MQLLQSLFLFLFFSYSVVSLPTSSRTQHKGRSYKVSRVRRGEGELHGPSALRKAYRKFGIVPSNLNIELEDFAPVTTVKHNVVAASDNSAEPDQVGAVSATSVESDAEFVSPVEIGGQKIVVTFDTGSADFWVLDTRLNKTLDGHTQYNPANSTTFKDMPGATFNVSYGDNSFAAGPVGTDTVNIGGAIVKNQAIGIPTEVSQSFIEDTNSNGLVGLGFSSINSIEPQAQNTFFANAAANLDEPVFTSAIKSDGVGEYGFGLIDSSKYQGTMANVSVDSSNGYWQFDTTEFAVGNGSIQTINNTQTAIADTGTSLMLMDQQVVDAYYADVPSAVYVSSAGGYIFPCNTTLPSFSIAIGSQHLATVPGNLIEFSKVGTNTTTGQALCYGGIQSNSGASLQILGDVFLKAFYVVFDMRGPSLGVAAPV
ncbi:pepsin-like aspartic protease [Aspergillus brunneoviolaceus CBS 621.78]|uniref:Aspergillopepsin A-like aspartic endopeptidase n=1 Tax=Aspergillus brunneoviolaceus CBS 621.78 TaxID=1450534 RepID=A0ACD1GKQ1_9EURO|nr:aspergillopepsin A-like aspartic endopeptidase [Aspergillus brunneoviolaceus CBS 621.78]RAH49808.1 aspergillopepsin A-like aspartic endopeptidase [Aspergillus brunneoviolaceus CBS 621.78]